MTKLAQIPRTESLAVRGFRMAEIELPVGAVLAHLRRRGACPDIPQPAVVRSGTLAVRTPGDSPDEHFGPGDLVLLGPGHDAWTIGQEPCVLTGAVLPGRTPPGELTPSGADNRGDRSAGPG